MSSKLLLPLLALFLTGIEGRTLDERGSDTSSSCKCTPDDVCWPSESKWSAFDKAIDGRLIKTEPIARSCYDGPDKDLTQCAYVTEMWSDQDFQTTNPIGRPYPYNITCAPIDYAAGQMPTTCILGSLPTYAANVTTRDQIYETLMFAKKNNVRLVVSSTGHDLLGRSDGYGALELWLHHYKNSIDFQPTYMAAGQCTKSGWTDSAIKIDGAYQWRDVYTVAKANNVIAVGGGAVSPGAIGGWPSGGGHGPASRNYGLGADQILEVEVMLANGTVIVANHCQHTDLLRAMRGGGPGYGITLSSTIKAHPNVDVVTAHRFAMAPLFKTEENKALLDAVTVLLQSYPALNDAGYAGYAYWFRNFPTIFVNNATSGYTHGFWTIGKTQEEADAAFAPVRKALAKYKCALFMSETFETYTDYWSFYEAESGLYDPTGDTSILTSRMIDSPSVADYNKTRDLVEIVSGEPDGFNSNVVLLVSGGQVFEDAKDETSGLNPAWRISPFVLVTGGGISKQATNAERKAANDDITYVKGVATKAFAPNTGGYMNEGDRNDPDYINTFYGVNYPSHLAAKNKYDPNDVFYCPTCVGAEKFIERPDGPLCRVK